MHLVVATLMNDGTTIRFRVDHEGGGVVAWLTFFLFFLLLRL